MIHYTPGTPCWVDLCSPDVDASVAFYSDLFGWEAGEAEQTSGYQMFSRGGKLVSCVRSLKSEQRPPCWTTYISADDAALAVHRAEIAGGKVAMTIHVKEDMRMPILQDAEGTEFGIFQPGAHRGAQLFNQPGSLTFNLLMTREPEAGKRFYSEVFGWDPRDRHMGAGFAFTYFFNGVRGVAGLMAINERWPQDVPSHWQISLAVEDADATVARAIELGGSVSQPPANTPFGRGAMLRDPHGAVFSISQQTPEVRAAAQTPEGVLL